MIDCHASKTAPRRQYCWYRMLPQAVAESLSVLWFLGAQQGRSVACPLHPDEKEHIEFSEV